MYLENRSRRRREELLKDPFLQEAQKERKIKQRQHSKTSSGMTTLETPLITEEEQQQLQY